MKQVTDFLVDISDKMDKKLSVAQRVLTDEIAPNFDFSGIFGMRIFKSVCKSPIIIKSLDLAEPNTKQDFVTKSNSLPLASGGAPIADTIKESLESLKSIEADEKKIVMITAGEDTDGGVFEYEVEKAGLGVQVNIIGVCMRESDLRSAEKVALLTGGVCCNIPAEKINDPFAIREIVSPVIDALNGKYCAPTAPKQEVKVEAPKIEITVQETPQVESKIEIKQEPLQQEEVPRMAAFVQQPKPVEPEVKNVQQSVGKSEEVKSSVEISSKNFARVAESLQGVSVVSQSASKEDFDAVSELKNTNQDIQSLLASNMETLQRVLKEQEVTIQENQQLREAEQKNLESIAQLQDAIREANDTIQQLRGVLTDKDVEIEALNANKRDLQVAIDEWKERDKQVIIDLDANERQVVSAASEKILKEYLEKKYPNRVRWSNEKGKQTQGYDFEIVDTESGEIEYYIACKGAKDDTKTFFLTEKEWNMCLNNNRNYQVYLVRNVNDRPKVLMIDNLIGSILDGKVRPGASRNEKVKAGQVMLTLTK